MARLQTSANVLVARQCRNEVQCPLYNLKGRVKKVILSQAWELVVNTAFQMNNLIMGVLECFLHEQSESVVGDSHMLSSRWRWSQTLSPPQNGFGYNFCWKALKSASLQQRMHMTFVHPPIMKFVWNVL
jgi:hypothetical protein